MMTKIVFFDNINIRCKTNIEQYLEKDYTIYYFKCEKSFLNDFEIKYYIKYKRIIDVSSMIWKYELHCQAAFFAHENVDAIFEKYYSSNKSIKISYTLLGCSIELMYKKELLLLLEQLYEIELRINKIIEVKKATEIIYIPKRYIEIHTDILSPIQKNIKIIDFEKTNFIDKIKNIALLGYPIFLILKKIKGISINKSRKEFTVGISIGPHKRSIFEMNYWTEHFFLDEKEFPKEQVIFIDENGYKNISGYRQNKYNYTRLTDDRETISLDMLNKVITKFIPAWVRLLFISLSEPPFMIKTNRMVLTDYIKWNFFNDNIRIQNYVKRLLPDNISQIHILQINNIKTWFVFFDNTSHDYYLDWDGNKKNNTLFSFMYYDFAIIYGDIVERFFKKHRNFIGAYIKIGIVYGQIVHQLESGTLKSTIPLELKNKKFPKIILGIFDTSYSNWGHITPDDGIRFGSEIIKLLNEFPNMGIIFKSIKPPELVPQLNPIYNKLKNHERCLLYYMWENISASEVIACSDLVISAAYTSTSAEALAAKKKAIYYDVAGNDIGDKFYYNRYPNFVAHNYEELKNLINYWMNQVTESEFEKFLNTYVKDEIDPYLDRMALTRMRRLLMGEEHGS